MDRLSLNFAFSFWAMMITAIVPFSKPAIAQTDFPITEIRWLGIHRNNQPIIQFVVPDQDTVLPAYGGKLRRYDVHVAKMFEVSHFFCQQDLSIQGFDWFYKAANGNEDMGRFKVSCQLAQSIAVAYGLGHLEQTLLKQEFLETYDSKSVFKLVSKNYSIPVLNLRENKINKWMEFVQKFRPDFSVSMINSNFSQKALLQLRGKTKLPIFLPDNSFFTSGYISSEVSTGKYSVGIFNVPDCKGHATVCTIGGLEAEKGKEFLSPNQGWKMFKHIQLQNKTKGIFANSCGAYCWAFIQWKYKGTLYQLDIKNGQESTLIELANSAIAAGPR